MRWLAVVLALCCCALVAAPAQAASPSKKKAIACAKHKAVKRAATQHARKVAKRVAKARRRSCAARRTVPRPARPVAGQPGVPAPVAGRPAPAAGGAPAPPSAPAPITPPAPVTSTIGVEAHDLGTFVLRLTRASVAAGNLTIYFRNHDVSEHNLWLDAPAPDGDAERISEEVGEGGGAVNTVGVTPGAWRLYCSLPGHESMSRTLIVT